MLRRNFSETVLNDFLTVFNYENWCALTHLSDLMRALLLYKFGGFYLDFDTLVRADLRKIKNSVGIEGRSLK